MALTANPRGISSPEGTAPLYSQEEAAALVSRLCEALLGVTPYAHIVHPELEISEASLPVLQAALARLTAGEPLQYVLGYTDFLGMRLRVTPAVLIPRPETEELCRRVIAFYPSAAPASSLAAISGTASSAASAAPRAILDLCCGSGCITWAMARAFPEALVIGVDLSAEALAVARSQNPTPGSSASPASPLPAAPSAASSQSIHAPTAPAAAPAPVFIQSDVLNVSDLLRTLKSVLKESACSGFDLLLSNPPYVRKQERAEMARNVLDFEPSMALFVPDDDALLFYRAIRDVWFSSLIRPQARLALELNEALGPETAALFSPALPRQDASNSAFPRLEKDFNEKIRYFFAEK